MAGFLSNLMRSPLAGASVGLLQAGGPQPYPTGIGQALAQGLLGGRAAATYGAEQDQTQAQMQLQRLRMQQVQQQMAEAAQKAELEKKRRELLGQLPGLLGGQAPGGVPLGILAQIAPEAVTNAMIGQAFPDRAKESTFAEKLKLAGIDPNTPQGQALVRDILMKPGNEVTIKNEGSIPQGMRAVRDPQGRVERYEQIPGGTTMTAEERKRAAQQGVAAGDLDRLESLYREGKFEVGPVAGRLTSLSATTGIGLDPGEAEAASLVEGLSNALLAAVRGAQVGPEEQKKFEKSLPRLEQPRAVFLANLESTQRNLEELRAREAALRGDVRAATGSDAPPPDVDPEIWKFMTPEEKALFR